MAMEPLGDIGYPAEGAGAGNGLMRVDEIVLDDWTRSLIGEIGSIADRDREEISLHFAQCSVECKDEAEKIESAIISLRKLMADPATRQITEMVVNGAEGLAIDWRRSFEDASDTFFKISTTVSTNGPEAAMGMLLRKSLEEKKSGGSATETLRALPAIPVKVVAVPEPTSVSSNIEDPVEAELYYEDPNIDDKLKQSGSTLDKVLGRIKTALAGTGAILETDTSDIQPVDLVPYVLDFIDWQQGKTHRTGVPPVLLSFFERLAAEEPILFRQMETEARNSLRPKTREVPINGAVV